MSNNLGRTPVTSGDSAKEATLEETLGIIDGALSDEITFTWAGSEALKTASTAQTQRALCFVFAGATSGSPSFKFGSVQRGVVLVKNEMAVTVPISDYAGTDTINILSGQTIAVYVTQSGVSTILESQASYNQENIEDFAAAMFTGGTHSGISFSYNDATGKIDATVSGLLTQEDVEDYAAAMFTGGTHTNISFSYNDSTGKIDATVTGTGYTQEQIEDFVGAMLSGGSHTGITATYQDSTGTIDLAGMTQEQVEDFAAAMFTGGTHTGISFSYNDTTGKIDATVTGGGGYTDEQAMDAINAMFAAGSHDGVTFTYTDGSDKMDVVVKPKECLTIACSDETTAITSGTGKVTFRMPYAFTLTEVRASVTTAPTGADLIIDINEGGSTIMTTNKLSIDAGEKSSTTATTAATLTDTSLADDAEITIDFDQVGSTIAGAGVKVYLIGRRT